MDVPDNDQLIDELRSIFDEVNTTQGMLELSRICNVSIGKIYSLFFILFPEGQKDDSNYQYRK